MQSFLLQTHRCCNIGWGGGGRSVLLRALNPTEYLAFVLIRLRGLLQPVLLGLMRAAVSIWGRQASAFNKGSLGKQRGLQLDGIAGFHAVAR